MSVGSWTQPVGFCLAALLATAGAARAQVYVEQIAPTSRPSSQPKTIVVVPETLAPSTSPQVAAPEANLTPPPAFAPPSSRNVSNVFQTGTGNVAAVVVAGTGNVTSQSQNGLGNQSGMTVNGSDNTLSTLQNGNGNTSSLSLTGNNNAISNTQIGSGSSYTLQHVGNGQAISVTQVR